MFSLSQSSSQSSQIFISEQQKHIFGNLLEHAKRGESEATGALYRQFLPGIFGYIAARVPDRFLAEDLTSEVFLKMVEGLHQVRARDEAGFAAWLLQIARFTVAGYYRGREKEPVLHSLTSANEEPEKQNYDGESYALPSTDPEADPVHLAEIKAEWKDVVEAINMLTEEQRQVLVGRLIMGYDVATVAKMIGKKGNAVKALQFRALQSLQRFLSPTQKSEPEKKLSRRPKKLQEGK